MKLKNDRVLQGRFDLLLFAACSLGKHMIIENFSR